MPPRRRHVQAAVAHEVLGIRRVRPAAREHFHDAVHGCFLGLVGRCFGGLSDRGNAEGLFDFFRHGLGQYGVIRGRQMDFVGSLSEGNHRRRVEEGRARVFGHRPQQAGERFAFCPRALEKRLESTVLDVQFGRGKYENLWDGEPGVALPFSFGDDGDESPDSLGDVGGAALMILAEIVCPQLRSCPRPV